MWKLKKIFKNYLKVLKKTIRSKLDYQLLTKLEQISKKFFLKKSSRFLLKGIRWEIIKFYDSFIEKSSVSTKEKSGFLQRCTLKRKTNSQVPLTFNSFQLCREI